jgi:hypothetical protein
VRERLRMKVYPHGDHPDWPKGPPTVSIKHRGIELRLVFKGKAKRRRDEQLDLAKVEFLPDTAKLEPRVLRKFASQADLYVASAQAALRVDSKGVREKVEALRELGRPGRGLTDEFYRQIAEEYDAMVAGGEPHPIKALAASHTAVISTASRWVAGAKRRGLIEEAPDGK